MTTTITLIIEDPEDAKELLAAFARKDNITWHSDSKKAPMTTDVKNKTIYIGKSELNITRLRL